MSGATRQQVEDQAKRLRDAASERRPVAPPRDGLPAFDEATAYAIQAANLDLAVASGRRIAGRKAGLTGRQVLAAGGAPVHGAIFADTVHGDGEEISFARLLQPKVEGEVALVLGRGLPLPDTSLADLVGAVEYVLPAIEVADCRIAGWDVQRLDCAADNACAGAVVLGASPRRLAGLDLRLAGMAMSRGGDTVATGSGAACMGHPLNAAVWLARALAAAGRPLAEGEVLLTGALGPIVAPGPGDVFECRIAGLGSVRAAFGA